MSFDRNAARLVARIDEAMAYPEISRMMAEESILAGTLKDKVLERRDEIWRAAAKSIDSLEAVQAELDSKNRELEKNSKNPDREPILPGCLFLLLIFIVPFLIYFFGSWADLWAWLVKPPWRLVVALVLILGTIVYIIVASVTSERRRKARTSARDELRRVLGIPQLEAKLSQAKSRIDEDLRDQGVLPVLREIINALISSSFSTALPDLKGEGLSQTFDPAYEINTAAKEKLQRLMEHMSGGSIGISGSRGAGKSTLIAAFCDRGEWSLSGRKVLSVMTSAPVKYETRDFLLHLFSTVCLRLLRLDKQNAEMSESDLLARTRAKPSRGPFMVLLDAVAPGLFYGGIILLFSVIALAATYPDDAAAASPSGQSKSTGDASAPANAPALTSGPPATAPTMPASTTSSAPAPSAPASATPARTIAPTSVPTASTPTTNATAASSAIKVETKPEEAKARSALDRLMDALGVKPIAPIVTALALIVAAMVVRFDRLWTQRKLETTDAEPNALVVMGEVLTGFYIPFLIKNWFLDRSRRGAAGNPLEEPGTRFLSAQRWLQAIKFQQSYTSGWSGTLTLPVWMSGAQNEAVQTSERPMSLPEIVTAFRGFLAEVCTPKETGYKVVIGIDEMDKIHSEEDAQKFLNEIKMIFDVPDCFFLVSVSEHAMSCFERRGLPFRDVFDSSFDDIVYVDYLRTDDSKRLLTRRVIGMPLPFVDLCHCYCGGLPRDLIRSARMLLDLVRTDPGNRNLTHLATRLIRDDLKAKLRALATEVRKIDLESETLSLQKHLLTLEFMDLTPAALLAAAIPMLDGVGCQAAADTDEMRDDLEALRRYRTELGGYLYLCSTLLGFFRDDLTQNQLTEAFNSGDLDRLARARQSFALNPGLTRSIIAAFRLSRGLDPSPAPAIQSPCAV